MIKDFFYFRIRCRKWWTSYFHGKMIGHITFKVCIQCADSLNIVLPNYFEMFEML